MSKTSTIKSLSLATAVVAALAFGGAAQAQVGTPVTRDNASNPAPTTAAGANKTPETRAEAKEMKKSNKAAKRAAKNSDMSATQGTNAGASKSGDMATPATKGDGNGKS
ncbi:MAG: hypothetical protein JWQ88_2476 [Rhodoferax sp.]|nr:hypothetical protein [Rhodoferax sp.]